jgi:hypothetical protein
MLFLNLLAAFDNLNPMDWNALEPALNFLWQGLLAIFVVIGLIIVAVKLTAFVIAKIDEMKSKREENEDSTFNVEKRN